MLFWTTFFTQKDTKGLLSPLTNSKKKKKKKKLKKIKEKLLFFLKKKMKFLIF